MNCTAPAFAPRHTVDQLTRPVVALLLDPANTIVVSFAVGLVLLLHAFLFVPILVFLDVVVLGGYLAVPSRRAAVIDRMRKKRRGNEALKLRADDRVHWMELEGTVAAVRPSLALRQRHEVEQLLDLFVDVGLQAARWEEQIERFGRLAAATEDAAPLVVARGDRRARATRAVESLSAKLGTISTLIQLTCEDAVAARVQTVAGDVAADVEEARRCAQLALEAGDELSPA